ncbi:septal ring lytic transglycosylase RlpA family protein [Pseudomonas sp. NPDC078700]|uniref:septal ring lytic transglycosylase RlpA family protein n=1 Tax=Pseudomonas sp. NPDC078700 TaxID=3364424 RepID=UPI0037C7F9E1
MQRSLLMLGLIALLAGCASNTITRPITKAPAPKTDTDATYSATGDASYYAAQHQGQKTASGERFDQNSLTAAHRSLPFGSRVQVTNLSNNKTVVVRINDRGPFTGGRIIDLSRKAAEQLDMLNDGVTKVRIKLLP